MKIKRLNKTQQIVLDDMWNEIQIITNYTKRFKNKDWKKYLSKIESQSDKLDKSLNSK